jgi:hypothetical protein
LDHSAGYSVYVFKDKTFRVPYETVSEAITNIQMLPESEKEAIVDGNA